MIVGRKKIAYLLESTCLCGGVKVVFRQAEALMKRGYDVTVISAENYPDWFEGTVAYQKADPFGTINATFWDAVVGTTPRLLLHHYPTIRQKLLHLVQGYEPDIAELKPYQAMVQEAYALPVLRVTISEAMNRVFCHRYPDQQFISVGQGLETNYFYPRSEVSGCGQSVDRIFLMGPLSISFKQIYVGLMAFRMIKHRFPNLRLIRISPVDTRAEEELLIGPIDEYHVHVPPREVGNIFRTGNGIFISPSEAEEGFGLPAIEAMACGVPVVLTDILSYRTFATPCDYAEFASGGDSVSLSDAACILINDPVKRDDHVRRGLEVAAQFSYERVAHALEGVFDCVCSKSSQISI